MPGILELANEYAKPGLIDKINDPNQQGMLTSLSEDEQSSLAQNIVINWIEQGLDSRELLSIKRDIPTSKHDHGLTGFNLQLVQAVDVYAAFNGLCDTNNPHPERMIGEITPDVMDQLNGMEELKACLFQKVISPAIDHMVLTMETPEQRNELSKLFRSESYFSAQLNGANVVKDWLSILKSDAPWLMFDQSGMNQDVFVDHAELVQAMVSERDAINIGRALQNMPSETSHAVTTWLHTLSEAFSGLNRMNAEANIFSKIHQSLQRPSEQQVKDAAKSILGQSSLFRSSDSESSEPVSDSDSQMQLS